MCLLTIAYNIHPNYPLIIVSNRDEFYEREAAPAHYWEDEPNIYAGRDLLGGGTWIGVSKNGRFAAITNYRDPSLPEIGQRSRGDIVRNFLIEKGASTTFFEELMKTKGLYGGYNFIGYDGERLLHYNNILDEGGPVSPGIHSVSNASLNTPWPKVMLASEKLEKALQLSGEDQINALKTLLEDRSIAPDEALPNTGVGIHLERILSAQFVEMNGYGTRSSATILIDYEGIIHFSERTYDNGKFIHEITEKIKIE
jgi:uncharacterized protein with NRDE domain